MTVDKLSEATILVTLERGDIERYELDFTADTADTRRGLTRLLYRVGEECGITPDGRSYLIEALPAGDSALLIISVQRRRRVWRILRERRADVCRFVCADDLIALRPDRLRLAYELYRERQGYLLIPLRPLSERQRAALNEYGIVNTVSVIELARLREYGELISVTQTLPSRLRTKKSPDQGAKAGRPPQSRS